MRETPVPPCGLNDEQRKELRDYAWKYFDRHAEQRLKTMNFYILIAAGVSAATVAIAKDLSGTTPVWPLTAGLCAVSLVFFLLDRRTRDLTRHSEEALKILEGEIPLPDESPGIPHRLKLFQREAADLAMRRLRSPSVPYFTYSTCFGWIFFLFGAGSLIATIASCSKSAP